MTRKPLAIDLFCGLGGWSEGLLAEGWDVIGFDIEAHRYGALRYPAQLVLQDVLALHGAQFRNADLIVASPPCQEYSWMAMPWSLAKAKAAAIRADASGAELMRLNRLFEAAFRIQREACAASGHYIPLIVENVRGAQPWVGRARWNFGSFYLWGDVPALMPVTVKRAPLKAGVARRGEATNFHGQKVAGFRFDGSGRSFQSAAVEYTGIKMPGLNWSNHDQPGYVAQGFNTVADQRTRDGNKGVGPSWADVKAKKTGSHWTNPDERPQPLGSGSHEVDEGGTKIGGDWFSDPQSTSRRHGSKSKGRKLASAMIAKIPLPLARYIAATFHP